MRVLPVPVPEAEITEMFSVGDINNDGEINMEEFSNMVVHA